jgi:hypothetical protein
MDGDAAEDTASAAKSMVHEHEELAELARNLFIGVTAVLGVACGVVWKFSGRMGRRAGAVVAGVLLVLYAAPALVLANAAHLGGVIVHGGTGSADSGGGDRDD